MVNTLSSPTHPVRTSRLPLQGAESLLEAGERVASHLMARMNELRGEITSDSLKVFVGHGAAFRHAAFQLGVLQFEQIAQLEDEPAKKKKALSVSTK